MRIGSDLGYSVLSLNSNTVRQDRQDRQDQLRLESGTIPGAVRMDQLELSSIAARQLPETEIKHEAAKRFFNADINGSLDRVLSGQAPEVGQAVYRIIDGNFFASDASLSDEERSLLLETGLAQAKYLADRYMDADDASTFMNAIQLIAAVSVTRQVDPTTAQASYIQLPQKPAGAPDDYTNAEQLMKKHDPDATARYQQAIAEGGNPASVLLSFVAKLRSHPEWMQEQREERKQLMDQLRNTRIANRFDGIQAANVTEFMQAVRERSGTLSFSGQKLLKENIDAFLNLLASRP